MTKRRTSYEPRLWQALAAAAAMLLATASQTAAQQPPDVAQTLYRWTSPTPADQLAADTTVVPAGMGALFVPAMTNGIDEPEALVYQGQKQVGAGPNGRRIVLAPGSYTLRVGSAPLNQMVTIPVDVTAGNTTLVPVRWGALVVEVVDKDNIPHRGSYELIQVSDRQPYTVGFGADTLVGERIRTLLVGPGLYRIVRPGSNYRARTDFSTVLVPEGSVVYFKLVLDPDDGSLLGAGVVPPEELGIVTSRVRLESQLLDWDRPALLVYKKRRWRVEPDLDRSRHDIRLLRQVRQEQELLLVDLRARGRFRQYRSAGL